MCPTAHIIHMVKIDLVLFQSSSGLKITRLHETILGLSQHKLPTALAPELGIFSFDLIHFSLQKYDMMFEAPTHFQRMINFLVQ